MFNKIIFLLVMIGLSSDFLIQPAFNQEDASSWSNIGGGGK